MRTSLLLTVIAILLMAGCSGDNPVQPQGVEQNRVSSELLVGNPGHGSFTLEAKFPHIDSYPKGGGIFILRIVPGGDMVGDVTVTLNAYSRLNAELYRTVVNAETPITEVSVSPSSSIPIGFHYIEVTASNMDHSETITLEVEVVNWDGTGSMGYAQDKLDEFIVWLEAEHPELGTFSDRQWNVYATYPGILVVMHYTFLDMDWELRLCYHVMIPPYDWSKMLLRSRGEWDAILAAKRENVDGVNYEIFEIPVEDYGVLY
ncbi:MAG: hypothetical protein AB1746_08990 [Candidatus Zixiibacteriota bacterium]